MQPASPIFELCEPENRRVQQRDRTLSGRAHINLMNCLNLLGAHVCLVVVGPRGLEPRTSPLSGARSHHLLKSASDAGPAGVSAPLHARRVTLDQPCPSPPPPRVRAFFVRMATQNPFESGPLVRHPWASHP